MWHEPFESVLWKLTRTKYALIRKYYYKGDLLIEKYMLYMRFSILKYFIVDEVMALVMDYFS